MTGRRSERLPHSHDVIVIGAGAGGLTAAGGCAMLGLKVALIERGAMGGDCLNTGCVPSKALIAAAHTVHVARHADRFGVRAAAPTVDFTVVHAHVRGAIDTIAPVDSQERFEGLGCDVIRGEARLTGRDTLSVGGRTLSAPRIVLAVGSRPFVPPITGIENVPYLTSESLFEQTRLPRHLGIIGGGPIGMEMAQAFRRLGAEVTLISKGRPLANDDPDAAAIAIAALTTDGVTIIEGETVAASTVAEGIMLTLTDGHTVTVSDLLIAAGRTMDFSALGLDAAGVEHDRHGITVDMRRRTSNKRIYAIGDCRPGPHFTHASGYEGSNVVLEIGLGVPTKVDYRALPRVTYTDPELAQIGLTETEARERHGDAITVWRQDFSHNDRAICEGDTAGFVKLIKKGGRLIGATIVGAHAGDLLMPYAMAIMGKKSTFGIASLIAPYPNRIEQVKAVAFASHEAMVFNRYTRGWARTLARLRR